uniref:Uncharacterized protein n=1 Tax=Streptomyces sp. 14R-10 TaxID=1442159 RepID=W0FX05_9ACTN|nr:hypothetical protein [Streptomyces sp. 14R-10]AHF46176.1 hypothetical protein pZL1.11c [Streptomyces sp. 14R-10]
MPRFRPVPASAPAPGEYTVRGVAARLRAAAAIQASGLVGQADALLALVEAGVLERAAEALADRADDGAAEEGTGSYADGWRDAVHAAAAQLLHQAATLTDRAGAATGPPAFLPTAYEPPGPAPVYDAGQAPTTLWVQQQLQAARLTLHPGQAPAAYERGPGARLIPRYEPGRAVPMRRQTPHELREMARWRVCLRCRTASTTLLGQEGLCGPCLEERRIRTCWRCGTLWQRPLENRWVEESPTEDHRVCQACADHLRTAHRVALALFYPPEASVLDWSQS